MGENVRWAMGENVRWGMGEYVRRGMGENVRWGMVKMCCQFNQSVNPLLPIRHICAW